MAALAASEYVGGDVEAPTSTHSPVHEQLVGRRRACPAASASNFLQDTVSSALKRVCHSESAPVVTEVHDGVFQLPPVLDEACCRAAVLEVDGRVTLGLATTRGAALPSNDVYIRDLRCASRLHAAIDAGLHLVERCTGRLVDSKKDEAFVITYCASGQRGLGRHVDGDRKQTLLVTLDAPEDYVGGGTRFFPAADPAGRPAPFVIRPGRGGGTTFAGSVEHQGVPVAAGRRHVLVIFAADFSGDADARAECRARQRRAAKACFGARANAEIEWRAARQPAPPPPPPPPQRTRPPAAAPHGYRSLF